MDTTIDHTRQILPGDQAIALMQRLSGWANTTTIVLLGGCVFEFKGVFPPGKVGQGYYNLDGGGKDFEGHIKLDAISRIALQSRAHRGRQSYAFVFEDKNGEVIFKVFLGRDEHGELLPEQVEAFGAIRSAGHVDGGLYSEQSRGETDEK